MKASKEDLIHLYLVEYETTRKIAKRYQVSPSTIINWLKDFDIPRRSSHDKKSSPPKSVLVNLYQNQHKTIKEIASDFSCSKRVVSRWLTEHDIEKIDVTQESHITPPKEDLIKYYVDQQLTTKAIGKIYDVDRRVVGKWLKKYGIKSRSNARKYYHLRARPLTQQQKELIVGTLLGDGFLQVNRKGNLARLSMTHSVKQVEYSLWKKTILNDLVNNWIVYDYLDKRTNAVGKTCRWASIYHNELLLWHKRFYANNKKIVPQDISNYLKPFSMAVWIMDDGWKNHSNIRISSESFTYEDNMVLKHAIKANFDINCKVCEYNRNNKKYNYISFNKRNSILLTEIVEPYFIDSMKYKLVRSSTTECQTSHEDEDTV